MASLYVPGPRSFRKRSRSRNAVLTNVNSYVQCSSFDSEKYSSLMKPLLSDEATFTLTRRKNRQICKWAKKNPICMRERNTQYISSENKCLGGNCRKQNYLTPFCIKWSQSGLFPNSTNLVIPNENLLYYQDGSTDGYVGMVVLNELRRAPDLNTKLD